MIARVSTYGIPSPVWKYGHRPCHGEFKHGDSHKTICAACGGNENYVFMRCADCDGEIDPRRPYYCKDVLRALCVECGKEDKERLTTFGRRHINAVIRSCRS